MDQFTFPVLYRKFSWVQVIKIFQSSFHFITPIRILLINNRKRRSLTPYYSKLRRAYTVNIALRADLGQWQFWSAKFCCPLNARETKRESREAKSGYRISLARGVIGGERRTRIGKEREQSNPGDFPKTLTPSVSVHRFTHALDSNIQLSPSLAQQFLFQTFSCFKIQTDIARISLFLFSQYNAQTFKYFFFHLWI
jgi:hypothetical protein